MVTPPFGAARGLGHCLPATGGRVSVAPPEKITREDVEPEEPVVSSSRRDVPASRRYRSLDGLRGVSAMAVVIYHLLLVVPVMAAASGSNSAIALSPEWWLQKTPVRLFFSGHEAVLLFFILSGFVLTLPLRPVLNRVFDWASYYPRRLVRLYLPVWASVIIAVVLTIALPSASTSDSSWVSSHTDVTPWRVIRSITLLIGTSTINSPLWSLRWEVWFSLLLPFLFVLIRVARMDRWAVGGFVLLALISMGAQFRPVIDALPGSFLTAGLFRYLPVFGIGMLIALNLPLLHGLGDRLRASGRSRTIWILVSVAAVLLTTAPSLIPAGPTAFGPLDAAAYLLSLVGVTLVLFAAVEAKPFEQFLETRPVQWLGSRSFSLYLVHEPIVLAAAVVIVPTGFWPWVAVMPLVIAFGLLATEIFFRFVERPSHRLSRALGKRAVAPLPERATATGP